MRTKGQILRATEIKLVLSNYLTIDELLEQPEDMWDRARSRKRQFSSLPLMIV